MERGGITKAGNGRARRVWVEGAWSYRFPARVRADPGPAGGRAGRGTSDRLEGAAPLCARYRRLVAAGKNANLVTAAVAREMAAFAWAIACQVRPAAAA